MMTNQRQYPPSIIGIGRNYEAHANEMGGEPPTRPIVFMKNPNALIGDGEPIIIPNVCDDPCEQVDYEGELAVIIDRNCRDVVPEHALSYVRGYAAANDVSARWWQREGSGGQFVRGKSFDTFCPVGAIKPASQVPDPQQLHIRTHVNGELLQDGHTSDMIFPVAELVAELSRGMTILAGTILLTGSPPGVGVARTPPRFLREGDVVEVTIEHVGAVRNPVQHA